VFVAGRHLEQMFWHSLLVSSKNFIRQQTTAEKKKLVKHYVLGGKDDSVGASDLH